MEITGGDRNMRYVSIDELEIGMRLAHNLYDSLGRTLVGSGSVITEAYMEKLKTYSLVGVYIEDEMSNDIDVSDVFSPEVRQESLECVSNVDIDGCYNVANKIVDEILSRNINSLDLADLSLYDDNTYAHSTNVAIFSSVIGMGLGMSEEEIIQLVIAALLHDLGKLMIPHEILNKPGRLTQEEYQVMKSHAELSYKLIKDRIDISDEVKDAVRHHHENVDGSGYPDGIVGVEHSLYTKIIHVADVYDALISKRPYKKPYFPYEAAEYLMGGCGIMFDYKIVETMLRFIPLFLKGTKVRTSDGREGLIYKNTGIHNLRPIIKLTDGTFLDLTDSTNLSITVVSAEEDRVSMQKLEEERHEMTKPVKKKHIVIVDDMKTNLQTLKTILEDLYDITLLKSGEQLIKYMVHNEYPDLIIMDIDMPGMNGVETVKHINQMTNQTVPILFVTVVCDRETVLMCRKMNAAGYILRPYKPVFVKSEIKRILTGRSDIE